MKDFSISPQEMVASFWRNRALIKALTQREVLGRYRGSKLGMFWSLFNPLLMLVIYTFVFGVIFKARWDGGGDSKIEFALVLFAGLMVFNLFSECIGRAPSLILANTNYVKKVVFPLEILPWVAMGSALFHGLVSLIVLLVVYGIFWGLPPLSAVLLPLVIMPLLFFTMGISWALASLGVYLRDISQIIGVVITMLMFLSGIFYSVSSLPVEYQPLLKINPLVFIIDQVRDVLIWGEEPNYILVSYYLFGSVSFAWLGFAWFQKTRKGFADVL